MTNDGQVINGENVWTTDPVFDAIFDFNEQVIGTPTDTPLNALTVKQFKWTVGFIDEERDEFAAAFGQEDIVKMVDAILDLIYGSFGTLVKMGVTREQAYACMMAIHKANMTKKRGVVASRGSDEDAAKPAEFVPPDRAIGMILFGDDSQHPGWVA